MSEIVNRDESSKPATEIDPRFPSGPWVGFWLQRGWPGRQKMDLSLAFAGGSVAGEGRDVVGEFTFHGTYDLKTGRCSIEKRYAGRYQVLYDGVNEGDGLWLWGVWTLPHDRGGFHLWPAAEEDPTVRRLRAEKKAPKGVRRRVLVGAEEG